ncbi:MAG TPA: glycosyltransferase family 2 protein [Bdellovibrionota bacterium]|jgi:4,4'-diaponeurosporenoate glycosyltransferase|nr:glycosyltransferase family 2 protein [Bdellovibrionota bacterium]
MSALAWLMLGLALTWLAGFGVIGARRGVPKSNAPSALRVSIIIPARNEAENLRVLLPSIFATSHRPEEVLVVDDDSNDDTASVATELGAHVIRAQPLPAAGWTGKNWACHQGATAARGELFFFVDADVCFEANGFQSILTHFEELNREAPTALSVLPWHRVVHAYEELSIFFNLMMSAGSRRLVGQSLVVRRADYERAGGHQAVSGEVLENFFMTERFHSAKVRTVTRLGRGVLSVRMFPGGLDSLIEGWTKAFARGARHTDKRALLASVLWLTGFGTVIFAALVTLVVPMPGVREGLLVAYVLFAGQLAWLARRLGSFRLLTAVLFPVAWFFYQFVFAKSLGIGATPKTWKGRTLT